MEEIYTIYTASCENVSELKKQAKAIKRLINEKLRNHRLQEIPALTKIYALLYSAFVETSFLKMLHTPHGFSEDYISQIQSQRNLDEKWKKCIELAFQAIEKPGNAGEISNKKQKLIRIMDEYIIGPSQIRNKIAHGQWKVCLNNGCTSVNEALTAELGNLDYVRISILFHIYDLFSQTIEDLIESPHKAHYRFFYSRLAELEEYISRTEKFSLETKRQILDRKKVLR